MAPWAIEKATSDRNAAFETPLSRLGSKPQRGHQWQAESTRNRTAADTPEEEAAWIRKFESEIKRMEREAATAISHSRAQRQLAGRHCPDCRACPGGCDWFRECDVDLYFSSFLVPPYVR